MKTYKVIVQVTGTVEIEVDANSEQDAREAAKGQFQFIDAGDLEYEDYSVADVYES